MGFILKGFTQEMEFRVFAFEKVAKDQTRTEYTVRADLALTRRYDIQMQELPLLCRLLLERSETVDETNTLTLTEAEMCIHAKDCKTARRAPAFKKKVSGEPSQGV
jgi:hypothetical protein